MRLDQKTCLKQNSLDYISLLAAVNVMVAHTVAHSLAGGSNFPLWNILAPGPAVVVMFAISGFLVTASFERSKTFGAFLFKRIVRIYPALIAAVVIPVAVYSVLGYIHFDLLSIGMEMAKTILIGSFSSATVPNGAVGNGSLWTIVIQMQFYVLTPILYRLTANKKQAAAVIIGLILLNLCSNTIELYLSGPVLRLYQLSCLPYLYIYMIGMCAYMYCDQIVPVLNKALVPVFGMYIIVHWMIGLDHYAVWKYINPVSAVLIMASMFGAAFKFGRHRAKYDLSYGVYLWHLVVFDVLSVICGLRSNPIFLVLVWGGTFIAAYVSYIFIEKPCLKKLRKES